MLPIGTKVTFIVPDDQRRISFTSWYLKMVDSHEWGKIVEYDDNDRYEVRVGAKSYCPYDTVNVMKRSVTLKKAMRRF